MDYVKALEDLKKERRTYEHPNTLTVPVVPALEFLKAHTERLAALKFLPHESALREMAAQDDARREYFRLLAGLPATPSAQVKKAPKAEPAPQVNFWLAELKRLEVYAGRQYADKRMRVRACGDLPAEFQARLNNEIAAFGRHILEMRNAILDLECTAATLDDFLELAGRFVIETEAADV